jgi:dCTP deaminase
MILTGPEIRARLGNDISIEPFNAKQLNPNSYNLKLHEDLLVYTEMPLDMKKNNPAAKITMPNEGYLLEPGRLYLGRTVEHTITKNLVPMLEGRSSVGRLGLFVHVTAGFGDTGFSGFWTLEMHCIHPIRIYPGVEVCQIFYHSVEGDVIDYKSGKYQANREVQTSRLWMDFQGNT